MTDINDAAAAAAEPIPVAASAPEAPVIAAVPESAPHEAESPEVAAVPEVVGVDAPDAAENAAVVAAQTDTQAAAEATDAPRLRVTIKGHLQIHTGHMVGGIEQVFQADEEFEIADAEAVRELLERGLAVKA